MRKLWVMTVIAMLLGACNQAKNKKEAQVSMEKCIVLYYSQTGNTQQVADLFAEMLDTEAVSFDVEEPYDGTYDETIQRCREEQRDGILSPLKPLEVNLADYDVVFLGYPVWFGTYARPVMSLLQEYDFAGKTIVPFCTFNDGVDDGEGEEMEDNDTISFTKTDINLDIPDFDQNISDSTSLEADSDLNYDSQNPDTEKYKNKLVKKLVTNQDSLTDVQKKNLLILCNIYLSSQEGSKLYVELTDDAGYLFPKMKYTQDGCSYYVCCTKDKKKIFVMKRADSTESQKNGLESSVDSLRATCPQATVMDGYGVRAARIDEAPEEVKQFLVNNGYLEGEVEEHPEMGPEQPVGEHEMELFEAACGSYRMPIGTPLSVRSSVTERGTDYLFTVRSKTPDGESIEAQVYITYKNGGVPEFVKMKR